jgi:hypothetical protein
MRRWSLRLVEMVIGVVFVVAASSVMAEEATKVTKLRTEKVTLYDCAEGAKKTEYARKDFVGDWPIVKGGAPERGGLLRVQVGGQQYCVRPYAVETDKPVSVSAKCAVIGGSQQKSAATRGIGEGCSK